MKLNLTAFAVIPAAILIGSATTNAAPQTLGALFKFNGTLIGSGPASGSIYDGNIHSGVSRDVNASPSGLSGAPLFSDSYVLQGGDPFGGDTGDNFEVTQTEGHAIIGFFDIFTDYNFGQPAIQTGTFITANPDTGYLTFLNLSPFEFKGTIDLSGQAYGGIYGPAQFFDNSGSVDLMPGEFAQIVLNNESSNYGGYNHPEVIPHGGVPDGGATFGMLGLGLISLFGFARRSARA